MKVFKTPKGTEIAVLNLKGKDYLTVPYRIVWFREEHPDWFIGTSYIRLDDNVAVCKAEIFDEQNKLRAMAHKREDKMHFADFTEKAETSAIGRALALIGYGTQFAPDLEEGDRLADAPLPAFDVDNLPVNGSSAPQCELCHAEMRMSKKQDAYYCPNFQDESKGKHSYDRI